ncbi:MAG: hypothetical protein K2W96_21280 [Gemmataceae bacterium]|nr:hypothetical protein [Gemmataceae bacterium]
MPTHLHAIVFDSEGCAKTLEATLTDFRKFTAHELIKHCRDSLPGCFLDVMEKAAGLDRSRRFWQPTRHPVLIEKEPFWQAKFDYLHDNPRRKGLVLSPSQWRFSSAAYWMSDCQEPTEVPLVALDW